MVLHGASMLGTHDWYSAGTSHLLASQKKDGSWRQEKPLYSTAFALLCLSRAADPPRAFTPHAPRPPAPSKGPITGSPSPSPPEESVPSSPAASNIGPLPPGSVEDWLREALPAGELAARCRRVGPKSLRALVRGLRAQDDKMRQRAFETLREVLPDEQTERADRHPLPRGRLDLWLALHGRDLELAEGRFVLR